MERSQVAKVFIKIGFFDGRHQADEGKILAWYDALHPEMSLDWALNFVTDHYATSSQMIQPSDFNSKFRLERMAESERRKAREQDAEWAQARSEIPAVTQIKELVAEMKETLRKANYPQGEVSDGETSGE